jgi:IS5 family transposase
VLLDEVDGGIISRYEVLKEAGREHPHLPESIDGHRRLFGRAPELLTADRGLYSKEGEETAKRAGIRRVALPQSGRLTKKRKEYEEQRWFKRAFGFRAGIEGRISVLRRSYDLDRCPYHGEQGMGRWVGWGGRSAQSGQDLPGSSVAGDRLTLRSSEQRRSTYADMLIGRI